MSGLTVLYEDRRQPGPHGRAYGLHVLMMALVADRIGGDEIHARSFADVQPVPKHGVDNVLGALHEDYDVLAGAGVVVGIVDGDKLAGHVRRKWAATLPAGADANAARDAFLAAHPDPTRVRLLILDANLESVLVGIRDCDRDLPPDVAKIAIEKRGMQERERVLNRAAAAKSVRDCLQGKVPSVNAIADELFGLLSSLRAA